MDFSDLVALKIKELMKEKNINSNQLSKLTGIYSSTIAMFLTRKNRTIRLENLLYICDALGIKLSEFFQMKDLTKPKQMNGEKSLNYKRCILLII